MTLNLIENVQLCSHFYPRASSSLGSKYYFVIHCDLGILPHEAFYRLIEYSRVYISHVGTCRNMFRQVQTCLDKFREVRYLNSSSGPQHFQHFLAFLSISQYFLVFLSISQYFSVFLSIFQYFSVFLSVFSSSQQLVKSRAGYGWYFQSCFH